MESAAAALPGTQFHIFSDGPNFELLQQRHAGRGLLHLHTLLPEQHLAEMYARSTVQLVPQAPGTEIGSMPSKLPNLLAAGVQVLAIGSPESEVATLLHKAGTGTIVGEWDETAFIEGINRALAEATRVTPSARRANAIEVLQLCRVSSLAELIAGQQPHA
jgi:hypothetical protein